MSVLLQTSFGDIVIDLYHTRAPNACLNFIKLCKLKHYNNTLIAEVQKNYVTKIKPPRPTNIWKEAGEDKPYFKDQIDVEMKVNELGLVATANSASNMNTSQFFITLTKANLTSLSGKHTVFGKVEEGEDVLKRINDTYVDQDNRPQMNLRILHTHVIDDPFEDLDNMTTMPRSPSPVRESDRLEAVEHLEMLEKCKTQKEIIEATEQQKAKKQAMTLQILGDLPDSNLKPLENILFICKLNPITQERDLQVIFSRFGPIKSVEVVRDWKTGQSLQYGFIEFDNISSCEQGYLKMNNVIIDDRRIQVDFSQSVSKLLHKNRGGLLHSKPKFGDKEDKQRMLLPKAYTEGKNIQPIYEMVTQSISKNRDAGARPSRVREEQIPEQIQQEMQGCKEEQEQVHKAAKKDKKRKRSRSRSRDHHHRKHKHRHSRSRSKSNQKHKSKKHKSHYDRL